MAWLENNVGAGMGLGAVHPPLSAQGQRHLAARAVMVLSRFLLPRELVGPSTPATYFV